MCVGSQTASAAVAVIDFVVVHHVALAVHNVAVVAVIDFVRAVAVIVFVVVHPASVVHRVVAAAAAAAVVVVVVVFASEK